MGASTASADLVAWLQARDTGTTYLAATFGAQSAASLILASDGASILPIGGFNGSDAVPTLDGFIDLVESGQLRYVIAGQDRGSGAFGGGGGAAGSASTETTSAQIRSWVGQNCELDSSAPDTVYDCG